MFLVINRLWIPFFMRPGVTSIYEYLEQRFGLVARWLGAGLFVFILRLFWMSTIVLTASRAVAQITHDDLGRVFLWEPSLDEWTLTVMLSVGVFATFCTMHGGIKAVILEQSQCVGIKIHPEEHLYPIRDHGKLLFEFAARHDAIVLAHSGDPSSRPADFVGFANSHPNVTLILAHLGNGGSASGDPDLQVRSIQASRHGNVYVDTSSARSMMPGLIEWAVCEIGAERILFGTDSPLYFIAMQRARIDLAELDFATKKKILRDNTAALFRLEARSTPHESVL